MLLVDVRDNADYVTFIPVAIHKIRYVKLELGIVGVVRNLKIRRSSIGSKSLLNRKFLNDFFDQT